MPRKPSHPARRAREAALAAPEVVEVKAGVFKNTCLQLLDEVRDRRIELVITKHGKPVARVVPLPVDPPSSLGFMRGTVIEHGDIVSPDFEPWGDLGDLG